MSRPGPALTRGLLLAFSLPAIMQGFTHTLAGQVLTGVYAKYFGLSLSALGAAVLVCKIFDAAIDPLVGVWSDATHRRTHTRKDWVMGGALIAALALWFLFRPAAGVSVAYFTGWFIVAYIGWTMTEIPYRAWSVELTSDYAARTRIAVWVLVAALAGAILVFVVPLGSEAAGLAPTREFAPQTLLVCAWIAVTALPLFTLLAVLTVPNGTAARETPNESWRELAGSVLRNRPLLAVNGIFLLQSLAAGLSNGVAFLYLDVYLGLGERLPLLLVLTVPMAVIAAPVWGWLCSRYEKHRAWAFALGAGSLVSVAVALVPPGPGAFVPLAALMLLNYFFGAAAGIAAPSMLGDVVDYGRLQFGRDRAGVYYSFYTLIQKTVGGAGMAIGLMLLDWFGFDATGKAQSAAGIVGAKFTYAWLPAAFSLAAVPFLVFYPITRARHAAVLRELELRDGAVAANTA